MGVSNNYSNEKLKKVAMDGVCLEEITTFDSCVEDGVWTCPFCANVKVDVPEKNDATSWESFETWLFKHYDRHRVHMIQQASLDELTAYKMSVNSAKGIRTWVSGTMKDNGHKFA